MFGVRFLVAMFLLCPLASVLAAPSYRLQAPEEVIGLLERFLPEEQIQPGEDEESARLGLIRRVREKASELLATEGYFSPRITQEAGGAPLVIVEPGPRTQVTTLDIRF